MVDFGALNRRKLDFRRELFQCKEALADGYALSFVKGLLVAGFGFMSYNLFGVEDVETFSLNSVFRGVSVLGAIGCTGWIVYGAKSIVNDHMRLGRCKYDLARAENDIIRGKNEALSLVREGGINYEEDVRALNEGVGLGIVGGEEATYAIENGLGKRYGLSEGLDFRLGKIRKPVEESHIKRLYDSWKLEDADDDPEEENY
jgi:hypothetical protein